MGQLADRVIQRYRQNQGNTQNENQNSAPASLSQRVIARHQGGVSAEIAQPQQPETRGIFDSFINYVKTKSVENAKGNFLLQNPRADQLNNYEDLNTAQKVAGAFATPVNVARDFGKPMVEAAAETGAAITDVATRMSPLETLRNMASGGKKALTEKEGDFMQRFEQGVQESRARKTLYEKLRSKIKGEDVSLTKEDGGVNWEEGKKFIGRAMEAPTYFYAGAKGFLGNATGKLGSRLLSRTSATLPEAAINAALQSAEESDKDLGNYMKRLGMNVAFMSVLSNSMGELSRWKKADIDKIASETGVPKDKVEEGLNKAVKSGVEIKSNTLDRIYDESIDGMKKQYEGTEIMKDGVLNEKLSYGRIEDVAQKLDRELGQGQGDLFRKRIGQKQFSSYDDLSQKTKTILDTFKTSGKKVEDISVEKAPEMALSRGVAKEVERKGMLDIFKGGEKEVNLRKLAPAKTQVEVTVKTEPDIDQIIKDSGYIDYTTVDRTIDTATGGKAAGRARYDFEADRGIIQVAKDATPKTKAHEFAHVSNQRLGEGQEKLSTELSQYLDGKRDIPKAIREYAQKRNEDIEKVASDIVSGIKSSSRMEFSDAVKAAKNPSEEFSAAVANTILREQELASKNPIWVDFVKSEITRSKNAERLAVVPRKETMAKRATDTIKEAKKIEGKTGNAVRDYVRNKTVKFRELRQSITRKIPTTRLELGEDFHRALQDTNVGVRPMSTLPPLGVKTKRGTYAILDGNKRLAEMMKRGAKEVEIITDEQAYRKLSQLEEDMKKSRTKKVEKKEVVRSHERGESKVREYVRTKKEKFRSKEKAPDGLEDYTYTPGTVKEAGWWFNEKTKKGEYNPKIAEVSERVFNEVKKIDPKAKVYLRGSWTEGGARKNSDIDFYIESRNLKDGDLSQNGYDAIIGTTPAYDHGKMANPIEILNDDFNNKFRLKDDFEAATGVKITDKQEKEIMELNKKIFGDEDVKITPQILANKEALGSYRDGMIKIVGGQADAKETFYHEAVHKYLDVFTSEDEQVRLLELAQKKYGIDDYREIEERLAEDFINYAKSREGLTGEMKLILDKVINRVKSYFKNEDAINTFYADIMSGKKEVIGETKRTVKVKTPANITAGGTVKKQITPIKSESIRTDKINSSDDVKEFINKFSTLDKEVIDRQRRGRINEKELEELSIFTGIKPNDVINAKAGSIVNAENAIAVRKMMATMAGDIVDFTKTLPINPDRSQIIQFKKMVDRYRGVQKSMAGFRSEAGRLLKSFDYKIMPEEYDMYDEMLKAVAKIDKDEADSLQRAVKLGKQLKPDNMFTMAIKAGVDTRNAFLLYSPPTHIANLMGNTWKAMTVPLQKFIGEKVSKWSGYQKGIEKGEAAAHLKGMSDALPESWKNLKKDLNDIVHGREMEGGFEKSKDVTTGQTIYNVLRKMKRSEGFSMKAENVIKTSFRLLTAGDRFFRTINFAGELYSQAIRKATQEGLTGNALMKRIEELVDDPIKDEKFFKDIQDQVQISLFQEKMPESLAWINRVREKVPITKIIVPFTQTPFNVAREMIRTSPAGFLRPAAAKIRGNDMSEAQKALAYAQASIGTAIAYTGLNYVAQNKITGSLPTDKNEKEEFYAAGKQPYSIKIGDKWVSYRRLEPVASVLANTVNTYNTIVKGGDKPADEKMVQIISQFSNNFMDQTFVKGIMDAFDAISDPERSGKYYIRSMATSLFPSIIRQGTFATDKTMRETDSVSDSIKSIFPGKSKELPAKVDIFGKEVQREGSTAELFMSPFKRTTVKDDPVVKALEEADFNLTTYRLDEIGNVKLTGEAREKWLKMVGQATKTELDKLVSLPRFQNMDQMEKDKALRDTVNKVRDRYRDQAKRGLQTDINLRKRMTKEEQKKYNESDLRKKMEASVLNMR